MKNITKFVTLQMLTTLVLISSVFAIMFFLTEPFYRYQIEAVSTVYIISAIVYGTIPCFFGALLNKYKGLNIKSFKIRSLASWGISFALTLLTCLFTGIFGGTSEILGRMIMIAIPAVFSCITWLYYSDKFLKS